MTPSGCLQGQVMLPRHEARREPPPPVQVVTDVLKTDVAVKEFFKSFKEDPATERTKKIMERVEAPTPACRFGCPFQPWVAALGRVMFAMPTEDADVAMLAEFPARTL